MTIERPRASAGDACLRTVTPRGRKTSKRPILPVLLIGFLLGAAVGCGERDEPAGFMSQVMKVGELPEPVLGAARKALPGITFDEAWKNLDRGASSSLTRSAAARPTARSGKFASR